MEKEYGLKATKMYLYGVLPMIGYEFKF